MVKTSDNLSNLLNRKAIRGALKLWNSPQTLGQQPLSRLAIVEAQRRAGGYADTPTGYGIALRDVLTEALEHLRPEDGEPDPTDKRWRPYLILHGQYVEGRAPDYLCEQLGIARSTYNHAQAGAHDALVEILQQWEQNSGTVCPVTTSVIPQLPHFRGRQTVLQHYQQQLEETHMAFIIGMPGIGKTALGAELAMRQQEMGHDVFWMSFGKGINTDIHSLFWEIAVFMLEIGRKEFWHFLSLEHEAELQAPLHTKMQRLIRVLEEGEYTLCFDNFHLVNDDPDITTFFGVLRERATYGQAIRLLVMGQEKPAFIADLEIQPLGGLDPQEAYEILVDSGITTMPQRLFEKLHAVTGGHPVFLQLFAAWVVKNDLAGMQTEAEIAAVEQFIEGIARTSDIETFMLVRIYNALSPEEQRLAELMSAFRLPFDDWDEAIIEIWVREGIENPTATLASLLRRHVVTRMGGSGFIKFQPLIRKYFYNRLRGQLALKRRLHQRIGAYYENFKDEYLEAAYHYREAADYVAVVTLLNRYYRQLIGAGKARRILDVLSTLRQHQLPPAIWPVVMAIRGEAHAFLGNYEQSLAQFEMALEAFHDTPLSRAERRRAADVAWRIGRLYGWQGRYDSAHERMNQALQILGDLKDESDRALAALIQVHIGWLFQLQGQLDWAEQACRQALELLGARDNGPVGATAYNELGVIYQLSGRWDEAIQLFHHSRAVWEGLGDRYYLARVTGNLGDLHLRRGELALAERFAHENLAFWNDVGAKDDAGYARLTLGEICLIRGQWERARAYYTQALVAGQKTGNQKLLSQAHCRLGYLDLALSHFPEARENLEHSLRLDPNAENYRGLSELQLALGDLDQALENARHALSLVREAGMPFHEGVTLRTLGRIYHVLEDMSQAQQDLKNSLLNLERLGARYEMGRTLYFMALLESTLGKAESARGHLQEAIAIFDKVGARVDLERAQRAADKLGSADAFAETVLPS